MPCVCSKHVNSRLNSMVPNLQLGTGHMALPSTSQASFLSLHRLDDDHHLVVLRLGGRKVLALCQVLLQSPSPTSHPQVPPTGPQSDGLHSPLLPHVQGQVPRHSALYTVPADSSLQRTKDRGPTVSFVSVFSLAP